MRLRLIGVLASLLMIVPVAAFARTSPPIAQGTTKTLAPYASSAHSKKANKKKAKPAKKAPKKGKKAPKKGKKAPKKGKK